VNDAGPGRYREARLRPNCAKWYPAGCPVGEWITASTAAAYVLAHREIILGPEAALAHRPLDDEMWDFRGGEPSKRASRTRRRRLGDRPLPGRGPLLSVRSPGSVSTV